ncbi:hypothetical protein [Stenotrophomonas sepilia]|uniref:hypothetical protein n=1 Tax=Stenotrophomonas sepilia TaxID=2860290 RepID=UPI002E796A9F|nr:hypothetical protein [Stenotrophomonas sepilia]
MSWWDGFSTCSPPGEGDCVVWWDAWAAIFSGSAVGIAIAALAVAWVGIGVTAASAFAVWKLGIAANEASGRAVEIADSEATRNNDERLRISHREETEALLVLLQIHFETTKNIDAVRDIIVKLRGAGLGEALFQMDQSYREGIFQALKNIAFPAATSVLNRLHYVDRGVSGSLVRAMGMTGYIQDVGLGSVRQSDPQTFQGAHEALTQALPEIVADLERVREACVSATTEIGLKHVLER